ncbi:MAG: hypothetical protein ACOYJA_11750 [Christensenellales bacterium]
MAIVLCGEPLSGFSIESVRERLSQVGSEGELAALYASVCSQAWWVADDAYDYAVGTAGYRAARARADGWFALCKDIERQIFRILQSEGVSIPQAERIAVLSPFMERNGFYDGDGWWIAQAIPSAPGTGDAQSAADHHTPLRSPK